MKIKQSLICLYLFPFLLSATTLSVDIINDTSSVLSGGSEQSSTSRTLAIGSVETSFNDNFTFYADVAMQRGDNGSTDTGDIQAYSNIDADDFSKLYEAWLEGNFEDHNLRFKVGQIDANTEFASVEVAGEFINSSMGFSPSISYFPTYPTPTMAGAIFWQVSQSATTSFAVFSDDSNNFDEIFSIAEWTQVIDEIKIKAGAWHQTGEIEKLSDGSQTKNNTYGFYATAEGQLDVQLLLAKSVGWYSQLGYADEELAEINFHFGAGITLNEIFNREGDMAGAGVTYVTTSRYLQDELQSKEAAVEVFYRFQVNEYLALKPDVQYIITPAVDKNADNALVVTLRAEISF